MVKGQIDQWGRNTAKNQPRERPTLPLIVKHIALIPLSGAPRPIASSTSCMILVYHPPADFYQPNWTYPIWSTSNNINLLILYDFDSNCVHAKHIPSCTCYQIVQAYQRAQKLLTLRGLLPKVQELDNDALQARINSMEEKCTNFQLVSPQVQRRNTTERTICTFKNHSILMLYSTNPTLNLDLWDKLLP